MEGWLLDVRLDVGGWMGMGGCQVSVSMSQGGPGWSETAAAARFWGGWVDGCRINVVSL